MKLTLDFTTRPARVLLAAVRVVVPMAAARVGMVHLELPIEHALLLGALTYYVIRWPRRRRAAGL